MVSRRRGRPGDRDGDGQQRTFRHRTAQIGVSLDEDGKPQTISHFGAEDVPLELWSLRRQRQHDAGDAAAEARGEGVPRRRAEPRSGHAPRVQRQHLRAHATANRSRRTHQGRGSSRALGRDGPLRRILHSVDMLGKQPGRRAMIVFSDGEDQGSHSSITDVERRLQASDVTLYMIAQGRGVQVEALKTSCSASSSRPADARSSRTTSISCKGVFRTPRRTVEPVIARVRVDQHEARRHIQQDLSARRRPELAFARGRAIGRWHPSRK